MNPVVLQLANGNLFFAGLFMAVTALFLRLYFENRVFVLALRIVYIAGIACAIFSATPISIWLYCLWSGVCVIAAMTVFSSKYPLRRKAMASFAVLTCSLVMCLLELPYHLSPTIKISPSQTIFVIGDSISAGLSAKEQTWPVVLGEISHIKVINLAKPAATVESAMDQSAGVTESNSVVIIEIGGNDLLGHVDSKTFLVQLDKLLGRLKHGNNQIVMFELPLLPFCNGFGAAQRNLAKKYDIILIPKHFMTDVFALQGGTLDGLHLSQKGHDAMANLVRNLLKSN